MRRAFTEAMIGRSHSRAARWLELSPETWRAGLLGLVLRATCILGTIVCVPSVVLAVQSRMVGVAVMDAVALVAVYALAFTERGPSRRRAALTCLVFYALGAGLMVSVGSISQIYLVGFSLLTTLLLSARWGLAAAALNVATMLAIGFVGIASPEMVVPRWSYGFLAWTVITANFLLVNASLVLVLGAVIDALEAALGRATQSRALLRIAGLTARIGGWQVAVGADRVTWSDEVCELHEVPPGTSPTLLEAVAFYSPGSRAEVAGAVERCGTSGRPFDLEAQIVTAKGTQLSVRAIGSAVHDAAGVITHVNGSVQDITVQKTAEARHHKLEEQFRQAQKMETVGNLAGGIAHDLNNVISVVLSYSELLADDLAPDDSMRADLAQIGLAGQRAAALTRQLLAFSRQQVLAPTVVDLAAVVAGMEVMLRRLIGEDVTLTNACAAGLGKVLVDPGQIEQVVMNLAVNARDAMPQGGMLTIETSEVALDEHYAAEHVGVTPGPHLLLAVSDTGSGIDRATQARMFEPFFTTKEKGKGTGLGLATVFGIVQQSGGTIWVYSELGKGTTFKIYLPIVKGAASAQSAAPRDLPPMQRGSETILLVEDEDGVRRVVSAILARCGYNVLEAQNGGDALLICEQHGAPIQLLVTDVVMPRMSGRQLAERLKPLRPEMRVLYMSGYTDDAVVRHGIIDSTIAFIQKPITPELLARKVRAVLDGAGTELASVVGNRMGRP